MPLSQRSFLSIRQDLVFAPRDRASGRLPSENSPKRSAFEGKFRNRGLSCGEIEHQGKDFVFMAHAGRDIESAESAQRQESVQPQEHAAS